MAGAALVQQPRSDGETHVWMASLSHAGWVDEDIESLDIRGFLPLCLWRSILLVAGSHISTLCLIVGWRGLEHVRSSRAIKSAFVVRETLHLACNVFQQIMLSISHEREGFRLGLKVPPYGVWFVMTVIIFYLATPDGCGRQSGLLSCAFLLIILITFFATGEFLVMYFFATSRQKVLIVLINTVVCGSFALEAALYVLRSFPETQHSLQPLACSVIGAMYATGSTIMAIGSDDVAMSFIVSIMMCFNELVKNISWIHGSGPISMCIKVCWGYYRRSFDEIQEFNTVVPASSETPANQTEAPKIYSGVMVAANSDREVQVIFALGMLFMSTAVRPDSYGGEPLSAVQVLKSTALIFLAEVLTDFLTGVVAMRVAPGAAEVTLFNPRYHDMPLLMPATQTILSTLMSMRAFAAMCPVPKHPQGGELLSLGRCRPS
eukprot:TRINITY_DN40733_c0_g1_i1.p1 TRINITY_DN40733_c0_g1~~TRINITY_DN40733_c0_g1_i1.p1  ORF type:complete len:477 (+),score=51.61 TRINITY_DN40733_c0_g1_i1:130-1431(+)